MSSIGTGYDLAASTFSPDGRIFQVEYATKAVDGSGTVIGLRGRDGVVFAVEKLVPNSLVEPTSNPRLVNATSHIGVAMAGMYPDGKHLVRWCQDEAGEFYDQHRMMIPVEQLVVPLSTYIHQYTLSILRPFGCAVMLGSWRERTGPALWMVDPAGQAYAYTGWALGKHRQSAKTEIEKLAVVDAKIDKSMDDLLKEAAAIIYKVRDESKDKNWKLELSWVGKNTKGVHQMVPADKYKAAETYAKEQMSESDSEDEDK